MLAAGSVMYSDLRLTRSATASTAFIGNSSQVARLEAMAGFGSGSGACKSLNAVPLTADTSQLPLLTDRSTHDSGTTDQ